MTSSANSEPLSGRGITYDEYALGYDLALSKWGCSEDLTIFHALQQWRSEMGWSMITYDDFIASVKEFK